MLYTTVTYKLEVLHCIEKTNVYEEKSIMK